MIPQENTTTEEEERPQGQDGRTVRVVSGRGYRYVLPFPYKLHEMLEEVEKAGGDFIVSWVSNGRAFKVHEPDQFVKKIVPLYFKQRQYKSFQRQLHLYGFQRVSEGKEKGAYYHKYFVREDRHLSHKMIRKMNKAESKAQHAKDAAKKRNPTSAAPVVSSSSAAAAAPSSHYQDNKNITIDSNSNNDSWPSLDMFNDSSDFDFSQHVSSQQQQAQSSSSFTVAHTPALPVTQMSAAFSASNVQQQQDQDRYAGTISWLLNGGITLPELASVLDVGSSNTGAPGPEPLLMNTAAPVLTKMHDHVHNNDDFAQDVISLFGSAEANQMPPVAEISVTSHEQPSSFNDDLHDLFAV